ncbi:hypothetical protein DPMN_032661 [Dreissena polymorpha]|uniref:Uncharacterized protein n=1 Tax=Dreissena polymorpha TaxID=45954 RepID=A0A9D4RKA5_DREPO|nr:hypothetical protein DPMN_032661 [Dreissena polymorpha]
MLANIQARNESRLYLQALPVVPPPTALRPPTASVTETHPTVWTGTVCVASDPVVENKRVAARLANLLTCLL